MTNAQFQHLLATNGVIPFGESEPLPASFWIVMVSGFVMYMGIALWTLHRRRVQRRLRRGITQPKQTNFKSYK